MQKKKLPEEEQKKQDALEKSTEPDVPQGVVITKKADFSAWKPKTELGKKVKIEEIKNISEIIGKGYKILEEQIVEKLIPNLETDLLSIGQSKGKFGGGKRSIWRQTQHKTEDGNKPQFASLVIVGNRNGYIGMGYGKAKETMPAREKATRKAKLNLIMIRRGCGSWECNCNEPHSIPLAVFGKSGSVEIILKPAPKGTGLCVEKECRKILALAGIKDVYSRTWGHTHTKLNMMYACMNALKTLSELKIIPANAKKVGLLEGEQ